MRRSRIWSRPAGRWHQRGSAEELTASNFGNFERHSTFVPKFVAHFISITRLGGNAEVPRREFAAQRARGLPYVQYLKRLPERRSKPRVLFDIQFACESGTARDLHRAVVRIRDAWGKVFFDAYCQVGTVGRGVVSLYVHNTAIDDFAGFTERAAGTSVCVSMRTRNGTGADESDSETHRPARSACENRRRWSRRRRLSDAGCSGEDTVAPAFTDPAHPIICTSQCVGTGEAMPPLGRRHLRLTPNRTLPRTGIKRWALLSLCATVIARLSTVDGVGRVKRCQNERTRASTQRSSDGGGRETRALRTGGSHWCW